MVSGRNVLPRGHSLYWVFSLNRVEISNWYLLGLLLRVWHSYRVVHNLMCPSRWAWYGEFELLVCDGAPVGKSQWVAVRVVVFQKLGVVAAVGEEREEAGSSLRSE